ncbi:MAG: ABC transporter ATP-binding protein [Clostridia bacterium]|nr:ABC transporter ATP-binding protein [Clostridia bacterium]MDO4176580.1 ABC transporter ATP-binding protein [Bacillota bacterium]
MELVLENISKGYKDKIAVQNVSGTFESGVIGLLGANGAGKTTLMRMICGLIRPTEGKVTFDGMGTSQEMYRDAIGYLPQDFGYYPNFTGRDFLMYMAALKGLDKRAARRRCEELLKVVNLEDVAGKKIKNYSGGMKQRLGIAQAVLNDPKLIILDEPTAGLDPKERVRFRNLIAELGKDAIVILSTHIVSDVEHIADRILMMKEGKIIFDGRLDNIGMDLEDFYLKKFEED